MTNTNKNLKKLVSTTEDDHTAESATLATHDCNRAHAVLECSEKTFDVDEFAKQNPDNLTYRQAEDIQELRFQLEQLRSINSGLKREVSAREEITVNINHEFKTLKADLATVRNDLGDRQHEINFLQHALEESTDTIAKLVAGNARLKDEAAQEVAYYRTQLDEQNGLISSNAQELRDLSEQVKRTETYADSLRKKLQAHAQAMPLARNLQRDLSDAFNNAETRMLSLQDQLEVEQNNNLLLSRQLEGIHDDHQLELRQLRFELGAAQETISSQDSVNEQLASDLIDNKGFRQALESQLSELENDQQKTIRDLEKHLNKARDEADEYDRKMRAKDKAIAALMSELANYTQDEEEPEEESRNVRGVDGHKPVRWPDQSRAPRTRVARLLIGNSGGREIRFPLFKDRLTIGRTTNNDIQLNVRYISRRHAVIVTDDQQTRLIDWGSKNGVFVNEKRIAEKFLDSGDIVTIGTTKFRYEERSKR